MTLVFPACYGPRRLAGVTPSPDPLSHLAGSGPGSPASFPRRLVGLVVDWLLSQLIAVGLLGVPWGATGVVVFVPLGVFAVQHLVLVGTLGYTWGHFLVGVRVGRVDAPARAPTPVRAVARTVLLCLALPPLIVGADGRGLHDRAAGTVVVRSR